MAIHFRSAMTGGPVCGVSPRLDSTDNTTEVDCGRCQKSPYYEGAVAAAAEQRMAERQHIDREIQEAVNAVFVKAREIADRAGYCSTYQEIESEIIADLPYEITPTIREYEVEVEEVITLRIIRTITVEAESAEQAEEKASDTTAAEERLPNALHSFYVEDGYVDSTEVEVDCASVS